MVTHAGADSDMSVVYFSLTINDKNKTIKAETSTTIGEIGKSQLTERYVIQNTVVFFSTDPMFSVKKNYCPDAPTLICWRKNFHKTSIKKPMALHINISS